MKTLKALALIVLSIGMIGLLIGCLGQDNESSFPGELEPLSFSEPSLDLGRLDEENTHDGKLRLYIQALRHIHEALVEERTIIQSQVEDLKATRQRLNHEDIILLDHDRDMIRESFQVIRLNRYMMSQSMGDGYQALQALRDNHDQYSFEQIKDILIDVYHTLNARLMMYQTISDELLKVQTILESY